MLVSELEKKPDRRMSSNSIVNSMLSGMSSKKRVTDVFLGGVSFMPALKNVKLGLAQLVLKGLGISFLVKNDFQY